MLGEESNEEFLDRKRKESFRGWPTDKNSLIFSLHRAGFWFSRRDDLVVCLHCHLAVRDWNSKKHDPLEIHRKFSPQCKFVEQFRGNLQKYRPIFRPNAGFEKEIPSNFYLSPPNSEFRQITVRLESFQNRNELDRNFRNKLANAGFFYNQNWGKILCFCCNAVWSSDLDMNQIVNEHFRISSSCDFAKAQLTAPVFSLDEEDPSPHSELSLMNVDAIFKKFPCLEQIFDRNIVHDCHKHSPSSKKNVFFAFFS